MKKIRPQNPIYLVLCLFCPWRFVNTYYIMNEDSLIISRYYAKENAEELYRKVDKLGFNTLIKFGLPTDIGSTRLEPIIHGPKGTYKSQEIQFLFKDKTIVAWNVRPYTKKTTEAVV
ncbi:hypothetical protein [Enterococcus sp. AZ126]|uniref:hypothetical protein n=1 Tax=Enterococcus sp. AZ126 TaxID=2774635 RepID=UPI003F1F6010